MGYADRSSAVHLSVERGNESFLTEMHRAGEGCGAVEGTGLPKPDNAKMFGRLPSGKARTWEDTYSRDAGVRSKTFPGIAKAMAEQWGGKI